MYRPAGGDLEGTHLEGLEVGDEANRHTRHLFQSLDSASRRVERAAGRDRQASSSERVIPMFVRQDHTRESGQVQVAPGGTVLQSPKSESRIDDDAAALRRKCDRVSPAPRTQDGDSHGRPVAWR